MTNSKRPRKLFSYVVDHDYGFAPNPSGGFCTLVHCKFSHDGKKGNVVELAVPGDWIVGTGGQDLTKSSGNGTILYAMKVTESTPLADYLKDARFADREAGNAKPVKIANRKALVSGEFYYFGRRARAIPARFRNFPNPKPGTAPKYFSLEKKFNGFKSRFPEPFIAAFENWISQFRRGKNGTPCGLQPPGTCRTAHAQSTEAGIESGPAESCC